MDRRQQEERFAAIVSENRQRFGKIARTYADAAAEDLLQEILLQVWRSLPTFSGKSELSTWCYRVAINTALTWLRKQHKREGELPSDQIDLSESAESTSERQTRNLLQRFLRTLSDIDQSVLLMHMDRIGPTEIAATMGTSETAIRTRLSRIRGKLASWEDTDG